MSETSISLSKIFDGWDGYQTSILHAIQPLTHDQLIWRTNPKSRSVGELASHIAVGVAFWILPRISGATPRGSLRLVWLSFWLINIGIRMVIMEAITSLTWLLLLGRLAEFGVVIASVAGSWKRVKSFGK